MISESDRWPSLPDEDSSPFYYSSLTGCGALFPTRQPVDVGTLPPGLAPAVLGGRTFAAVAYQRYHASYPTGDAVINELELSVLVAPLGRHDRGLDVADFLHGNDQTKQIGFLPLHVACDHDAAITPGIAIFGEPKFKATFDIETPSWNTRLPRPWAITVAAEDSGGPILSITLTAPPDGAPVALSPITTYSVREDRLIASRWQINSPTIASQSTEHCGVTLTDTTHPLGRDAEILLGTGTPAAIWQHITTPVATRFRPYYVERAAATT